MPEGVFFSEFEKSDSQRSLELFVFLVMICILGYDSSGHAIKELDL